MSTQPQPDLPTIFAAAAALAARGPDEAAISAFRSIVARWPRLGVAHANLAVLLRRAGRVVQREHLEGALYGFAADVTANALETQVSRLRRRLQDAGADVEIRTVRGVGYLLQPC